jgi:hypothetical protein
MADTEADVERVRKRSAMLAGVVGITLLVMLVAAVVFAVYWATTHLTG